MPSPYSRRSTSGIAVITTLSVGINDSVEAFSIDDDSGWPSGAGGAFYAQIDDEVIDCASQTAGAVTVVSGGRGSSDTPAAAHLAGATVSLVFTSADVDDANYVTSETVGKVTTSQDLLVADGAHSLTRLGITNNRLLIVSSSTVSWGQATSAMLATDSVGSAQIAADAVGSSEIAADAVTSSEIATDAVGSAEIAALAVTSAELAADSVITAKILDANVTNAKLAANIGLGVLANGYATKSTLQTNVGTGDVDITGLTVTVTLVTGRLYEVRARLYLAIGTAASFPQTKIKDGSTAVATHYVGGVIPPGGDATWHEPSILVTGSGSKTYKVTTNFTANTNNQAGGSAAVGGNAYIVVADIGAA